MPVLVSRPSKTPVSPAAKRVIRLSIGFQFFFTLLLWTPIFYAYQQQFGLSAAEILGIQSIYYVAFCLLAVPTGMISDRLGYRNSMLAGAAILSAANLLVVAAPAYWGFLAHFLLIAVARSLTIVATSAYLYTYLQRTGDSAAYKQSEGSARFYSLIGRIAAWPVVGLLMAWNTPSPYWLTAISSAIAVLIALRLPALPPAPSTVDSEDPAKLSPWATMGRALTVLRDAPVLQLLIVQGVAIFTLVRICQVNLFQPILLDKQLPVISHGAVLAAMTAFEALGSMRPGFLRRFLSDTKAVFLITIVMALTLAGTVFAGIPGTIALLCVFAMAGGFSFPIQRQLINDAIPETPYRATLLSIESIIDRAVCAVVALILGGFLNRGALGEFLLYSAAGSLALMAALAVLVPVARRRLNAGTGSS
ncbi:MFS transporter [Crossiella sp. CA198]|uniref:MFS transporter n=1 Tax=Crossiella sp. CA198 TaxID=3455607 RepID=UPI003F8D4A94